MQARIDDRSVGKSQDKVWRALVIDDVPSLCRVIGMALSSLGGQITTAGDGAEGLEIVKLAQKAGLGFHLILIDIEMPVMSGIEASGRIRLTGFTGPIIAITASEMPEFRRMAISAGCDEVLRKPLSLEDLGGIVSRYCQVQPSRPQRARPAPAYAPIAMAIA